MNRRRFLLGTAAGGSALSLAGCGSRPEKPQPSLSPTRRRRTPTVDRLRNVVEAGADPTGDTPINAVLDEVAADETALFFPRGRYRMDGTWSFESFESFELVGDGALFVPPDGHDASLFDVGRPGEASTVRFEGVGFDFRADETGGRPVGLMADESVVIRDVSVVGTQDVDADLVRIDVTDPDGSGLVERLRLPHGGDPTWKITGCEVGDENRGDLSFIDCHIEGFPDNGLYADPPEGSVLVRGGYFANNGIANVRVHAQQPSLVDHVHVRCDASVDGFENMRGIRLRGGQSIEVRNSLVEMLDVTSSDGGITIAPELTSATIRNTKIRVDAAGVNAIRVKSPDEDSPRHGPIRCERILVTGSAATRAAIEIAERGDYHFDRCCVHQTGAGRDGFHTDNADGVIRNASVVVTGEPYRFVESAVKTHNLSTDRSNASFCWPGE